MRQKSKLRLNRMLNFMPSPTAPRKEIIIITKNIIRRSQTMRSHHLATLILRKTKLRTRLKILVRILIKRKKKR